MYYMGVEAKAYYRFHYLKSEHWQNLRISKLASVDAKCFYCWKRDLSNDVHHLVYRKWREATLDDLIVLCRECHQLYHRILDSNRDYLDAIPEGKRRAVHTIKLIRIMEGKSPKISDHFDELFWKHQTPPVKTESVEISDAKQPPKVKRYWNEKHCVLCHAEQASTIIFVGSDTKVKMTRICLSCYVVYLNCEGSHRALFRYARARSNHKIPMLKWKKN